MAADLAISLATPFIEYLITPIRRQCGYILFYRSYLRDLEEGVDKLNVELKVIQRKCVAAERNVMIIEDKVTDWINGVNGAVMEASTLLLGEHQPGENTVEDFQSWFKRCVCVDHPLTLSLQGEALPPENILQVEGARAEQVADAIPPQNIDLGAWKRFYYLSPMVCYKKGRKAKKTMLVVQELNERIKTIGDISYEPDTSQILSAKDYETLRSRSEIVVKIIKAFSDAKGSVIGVWGMGGVGKSTLMKDVTRLSQEKNLFADIAMAVVSQNPDVKKIQEQLAVRLGLKFKDDENVSGRAIRLNKRLKPTDTKKNNAEPPETEKQNAVQPEENQDGEKDKKSTKPGLEGKTDMKQKQVLIILDDIWRGIDLEEIGIPMDAGTVKLLFTSRKQHVLSEMGSRDGFIFKLEVLKDKEPWRLFEHIVGEKVGHDGKFKSIGEEVVEKCCGLPVVLNAIATTLKNCSLPEWEDALVQFKGSKDAYSNLEISYRHLESDELKSLFLVCVLLNDAHIYVQTILYYSMGLGILKGTNTVRSARDKLKALFHDLQNSSLLLKDDSEKDPDYVNIHDVVREVGIRIASRDRDSYLITDEFELKEIPRKKLKKSKAISLPYVNFRKLPEGWECPELRMFLVYRRDDDPPISISDSFFEGMKELGVLDLSGNCGDSLPSSIQLLLNLNTLCLDSCSIKDLTIIGKLKQLQILTFIGSEIARLPKEIGELSELRVLNLEDSKLEIIEPQVLGKLTSLEELHLKGSSFIRWEDEEEMQPSNAKVSELNNLSNLSIVNIHIHNPSTIPKHLEFGNLAEYIIQIGDVWDWTGDYSESRTLKIKLELCRGSFLHEKWVQNLLKHTQDLHLDGIKGWQRSIHELCLDGFQELKHLHIQNSLSVQCVARSISNWLPYMAFTVLESLFLERLTGLEMISRGPIAANSFSKLKVIKVIDCGKLKNLFTYSMLKGLSQLKEIEVRDCEALQVIVTVDSVATNTETIVLQILDRIELDNLPNIMTFCSNHRVEVDQTEVMPRSLEIVQEVPCISTSTLFPNDQLFLFPLLKSLVLSSLPKVKYIWQNRSSVKVANLENLEVRSCDDLLIVIPSSLVKEVMKLETLMVRDCGSVQEVFGTSDGVALNLTSNAEILSRLNNLELHNLPFLKHIWENNHQKEKVSVFPNLKLLTVVRCRSLVNLLPAALLKSLNQLTKIYIENCKEMKEVIPPENDGTGGETKSIVFQSLVDVWLESLPNMVTFVWTKRGESINFPSLKELYVKNCLKMRSFTLLKEDASAHALYFFDHKVVIPKLERLDLIGMRSIQKIWHEEILEESFCQLEILWVERCQNLVDVIPSINMTGIGRLQFHNLKELNINNCNSLEEPIFKFAVGEEMGKEYNKGHYSLSQLEKFRLYDLPKLKHVVQPDSHVVVGFQSLDEISVADCKCVIELFPIATAATLSKLEDLEILRCRSMTRIFGKDEAEKDDEMLDSLLFPCLRSITVQDVKSLISLFLGISCMLGFPSLETLDISGCYKLKTFVQSHTSDDRTMEQSSPLTKGVHYLFDDKVELPNLKKLELSSLSALQAIWNIQIPYLNICDRIGQIMEITIKNCKNLEEFILESDNGEKEIKTTDDRPIFHSLANVWLENLPNMLAFIRARIDQSINFPSMKELYVESCPKMKAFSLPPNTEESGGGSVPLCFFDHKALFPKLERLDFLSVGSMAKIWHEEIPQKSFCRIEQLLIKDCQNLVNIFPSNMMGVRGSQFQNLKKISANGCMSLEGSLFDFVGEEKGKGCKMSLPQLETLWLNNLPKLQHVVEPNSHVVCSFPNLVEVQLGDNPCVIDLFPFSTAPTLSKLETLVILRCGSMRQVFGNYKVEEEKEEEMMMDDPILLFPCLRSMQVENLDNLISFFSLTSYVLHFPSLEVLEVSWSPKLKAFVQRYTIDELEESATFIDKGLHYLFDDKVELPNLKKLELSDLSTLQAIWNIQIPYHKICDRIGKRMEITIKNCENLEEFILESDNGEKEIITIDDPAVFHSLANVWLENLPNILAFIRVRSDQSINFPYIKEFYVESCPKMKAFSLPPNTEESGGGSVPLCFFDHKALFPKLERLDFLSVGSMEKIWHEEIPQKSFCLIAQLIIKDCQDLLNIFPSNMLGVRGSQFENLKKISATGCMSLEGSLFDFAGEEKGKGCKISLPQLETLWLNDLPKLQHVVEPSSHVVCSFPNLVEVQLGDSPSVIDLFPISTAPSLSKLENLEIFRCGSMRQVFGKDNNVEEKDEKMDPILLFPCLRSILVDHLDNLITLFPVTSSGLHFPSLEELQVTWCPKLKAFVQRYTIDEFEESTTFIVHYLFDDKVELPNLKKLELSDLSSLQAIWNIQIPYHKICDRIGKRMEITIKNCEILEEFILESDNGENEIKITDDLEVFHSLADVRLENLPNMLAFIRARIDQSIVFSSLKELYVESCPKMRAFFLPPHTEESVGGSFPLCFFDHKALFPKLERLDFLSVGSMEKIWHEEIPQKYFCQIEQLIIKNCENLVNIFPSNMMGVGSQFQNLKTISASGCMSLEGSLFYFPGEGKVMGCKMSLPQLEKLWLNDLPKLQHVVKPSSHAVYSFPNLVEVQLSDSPSVIDLFPISTAPSLSKLENLEIFRCVSMRQVFGKDNSVEEKDELMDPILLFPCLRSILVDHLDNLITFFPVTSSVLHFPSLEKLQVTWCPKLKAFVQRYTIDEVEESAAFIVHYLFDDKVELPKLKKLYLYDLSSLRAIWKIQLSCNDSYDGIRQIMEINIKNCDKLEEFIFESDDGETEIKTTYDPVVFHSLDNVNLQHLPSMVAFVRSVRRDRSITFPSLKKLYIETCPKMRAFYLPSTKESGDESLPLCFFDHKVLVPIVVQLTLISMGSIEKIWHEEISEESFSQLESLFVKDCQNLVNVFLSKCVTGTQRLQFQKLKQIIIRECSSLEGSLFEFVWEGEEKGKGFSLPQLEKLWLSKLPKLEHVIHPTSDVFVEFQSLVDISIANCQCLIDLLPSATTAIFSKLEKVKILRCSSMRYAFGKEAAEDEDETLLDSIISFPCLRTIQLQELDSLICFFLAIDCQLDFPSLEELGISLCPVLKTFVQRHKSEAIHYLFDDKVLFPKIEQLALTSVGSIEKIWHEESFFQPESLIVKDCQNLVNVFPSKCVTGTQVLQFQKLKKVVIRECSSLEGSLFKFVWEGEEKGKGFSLPQLEKLWLYGLPKLEHVIHPTPDIFVEFQSLVDISIAKCECLIDLLPSATAAIFSKLEIVRILRCKRVRYVFGKEAAEDEDEILLDSIISFPYLRTIQLQKLDGLICFFLAIDCQLNFPSLEDLEVDGCPVLKTFIQMDKSEDVHYLFDQKVEFPNLQKMKLHQLTSLQTIWNNHELLSSSNSCSRLTSLIVSDCKDLQHIFPASFPSNLLADESLSHPQERIAFGGDGNEKPLARLTAAEDGESVISFRKLEHLRLQLLPNLKSFSSANCTFEFPSLQEVIVRKCPNLEVFSSSSVLAPKLSKVLLTLKEQTGKVRWDGDLNTTIQNLPK